MWQGWFWLFALACWGLIGDAGSGRNELVSLAGHYHAGGLTIREHLGEQRMVHVACLYAQQESAELMQNVARDSHPAALTRAS